jgi:23S rRNA (cytidine1920-2'-O)/16S rRNA (cytidine1409-2'-O)-methyltransferase
VLIILDDCRKMSSSLKTRIDILLVERGLVSSRERARALILAGRVLVQEQKIDKPGAAVPSAASIRLLGEEIPFVSRGGIKLAAALDHWHIDVTGRACVDVGTSTGGFSDCLLQRGATHVTAIDTGFGQIAMKLRNDARMRLMERTNARLLLPASLPAAPSGVELTLMVMDVSFISATLVIGPVLEAAPSLQEAVVLVKPQFEAGREHVGKGGIVRDSAAHQLAIDKVANHFQSVGCEVVGTIPSPLKGAEGNQEFLMWARRNAVPG